MTQLTYIRDIAKYGFENDKQKLVDVLQQFVEFSFKSRKVNLALQLQSVLDTASQHNTNGISRVEQQGRTRISELSSQPDELVLEKLTSDYTFSHLVTETRVKEQLSYFVEEHKRSEILKQFDLPMANKVLFYGPSGCGKTLASYVVAGELNKTMVVVNLGGIVSSKLGETSKNLARVFRQAAAENCIIFLDEFDSLGKIRDYDHDHGEMKRVVNTILQLFDYLPQTSMVIAATNQRDIIDNALLRRFDLSVKFDFPDQKKILELIELTLRKGRFVFDDKTKLPELVKLSTGLSYYSIQKTLINTVKRSLIMQDSSVRTLNAVISTSIWKQLLQEEKKALA